MQCIIFSEEYCRPENLYPFTLTRRMQDIRIGILTIREKWEKILDLPSFDRWEGDYKESDASLVIDASMEAGNYLLIHANIIPTKALSEAVKQLQVGELLVHPDAGAIAMHFTKAEVTGLQQIKVHSTVEYSEDLFSLNSPWDLFKLNDLALRLDFELLTHGRRSADISSTNRITRPDQVFLEEGVEMEHCIINAATGPVYIGKNAQVMEGTCIRGPFSAGEQAVIKMGAKIYGATTVGPYCLAGGEIKNSILMGYSHKAHDGYLGDAVIGEWCNLGAGSLASNI